MVTDPYDERTGRKSKSECKESGATVHVNGLRCFAALGQVAKCER